MKFLVLFAMLFSASAWAIDTTHNRVQSTKGSFAEVREFAETAIVSRGMVINNVAHIGNMLERTAADVVGAKPIYLHAEALEFCSALVSRAMMEADPHSITYCPYVLAIYELVDEPGTIYVGYRRPHVPEGSSPEIIKAMQGVEALFAEIVADSL
ncbi:MAG: DUF302 domain-containing protein [Chromatiales bacterium]|nr:DUF302 domain-containing protein [Gammaproteobacteria bacterium]MBW6476805.1 DUF302 domain-containing protein [Chromatiales bacterium]